LKQLNVACTFCSWEGHVTSDDAKGLPGTVPTLSEYKRVELNRRLDHLRRPCERLRAKQNADNWKKKSVEAQIGLANEYSRKNLDANEVEVGEAVCALDKEGRLNIRLCRRAVDGGPPVQLVVGKLISSSTSATKRYTLEADDGRQVLKTHDKPRPLDWLVYCSLDRPSLCILLFVMSVFSVFEIQFTRLDGARARCGVRVGCGNAT
jgi:hypothetical protein